MGWHMTELAFTGVNISYGGANVVHDINLTVASGESFALVGESGSGKSTLLKAVVGLVGQRTGDVFLDGKPCPRKPDLAFSRHCQMVFQDPYASLHPRKAVDTVLREPLKVHGLGSRDEKIEAVLSAVGLDSSYRFRFPHQLSGGQRQRVAIARALILEPRLMLLDEPTSALDVSVQAEILNLLKRLRRERKLTYLLVTHSLPVVSFLCGRVAVMNNGRIVEVADIETLKRGRFTHPYSRELYDASNPNQEIC